MPKSKIEVASNGLAPVVENCVIIGEEDSVRLAFLIGDEDQHSLLAAVTLTRSQLSGLAGMAASMLDTDDPRAISLN